MRELMRGYIEQRRLAREYDDSLRRKVNAGHASMRSGRGRQMMKLKKSLPPDAIRRQRVGRVSQIPPAKPGLGIVSASKAQ
jgi:hypothetical protein